MLSPSNPANARPTDNRAFLYGDGVFETILYTGGRLPLLAYHHERLLKSLALLRIAPGNLADQDYFVHQLLTDLPSAHDQRIRITVYREATGQYRPDETGSAAWSVLHAPVLSPARMLTLKAGLAEGVRLPVQQPYTALKSCSALPYVLAGLEAGSAGLDTIILLNTAGRPAELLVHNLFLLLDGTWYTPPLTEGPVAGVMRAFLLDRSDTWSRPVAEKILTLDDLASAEACIGSNAVRLIDRLLPGEQTGYAETVARRFRSEILKALDIRSDP